MQAFMEVTRSDKPSRHLSPQMTSRERGAFLHDYEQGNCSHADESQAPPSMGMVTVKPSDSPCSCSEKRALMFRQNILVAASLMSASGL